LYFEESFNNITVNCTHKILATGFREIVVSSVSGSSSITVNSKYYGIEIEDYAFILSSLGPSEGLIPLISTSCPTSNVKSNYIHVYSNISTLPPGALPVTAKKWTLFGTYDLQTISGNTDTSSIGSLSTKPYNMDESIRSRNSKSDLDCNQGKAQVQLDKGKVDDYYLNTNGLSILREGASDGSSGSRMFGIPQDTTNFLLSSLPTTYIGLMAEAKIDGTNTNIPQKEKTVSVSLSNSEFIIKEVDPKDGTELDEVAKITIGDKIDTAPGFRKASITMSGSSRAAAACAFDTKANGNKTFIVCTAFHPVTNKGVVSFIMVNK
jgi:hypothetical protein